jgi:endonuclease/exonuclease/phosphatase family metal-dependent hydrolase
MCIYIFIFVQTAIGNADTTYVSSYATETDGSRSNPYRTLNEAVCVAAQGDVINLRRGAYNERLRIDRQPTIDSYGNSTAVIGQYFATQLRVLTHNVYALDENNCEKRASRFGEMVASANPPYDIVGVQEYYNALTGTFHCDDNYLLNAIQAIPPGRYLNSDNYERFNPDADIWDPDWWPPWKWVPTEWATETDGGIGIFTLHPIREFNEWEWDVIGPNNLLFAHSLHGFIFARIEIPFTSVSMDIYVVHLNSAKGNLYFDDCDQDCRRKELEQLASKISELSRSSGNPVLVMGDFNIGGPPPDTGPPGNPGYDDIISILRNPVDLWTRAHSSGKLGYTADCVENTILTDCNYRERIDYIFVLTDPSFTNSPYDIVIANPDDVRLVKWAVPSTGGHVSDHFGVEATIQIRERRP